MEKMKNYYSIKTLKMQEDYRFGDDLDNIKIDMDSQQKMPPVLQQI